MNNCKIIKILKTFSYNELKEFEKFITSHFFNKGRNYLPFLKELKKFYPEFDNLKLTKEYIYKKLYPDKIYKEKTIKNLISGLTSLSLTFLAQINSQRESVDYYINLSDELQLRGLFKLADKNTERAFELLNNSGIDKEYFKKKMELQEIKRQISIGENDIKKNIDSLSKESDYFLFYVLLEFAEIIDIMNAQKYNFNVNFDSNILFKTFKNLNLDNILLYIKENSYEHHEIFEFYYYLIKLTINNIDEILFNKVKILFLKNMSLLSRNEKYDLFVFLESICAKLKVTNTKKYNEEIFKLYQNQLSLNLYNVQENHPMNLRLFRNIFITALNLKEYEWVEKFINNYIKKLLPESRENMFNFSYANLYFYKSEFEKALHHINEIKFDIFAFKFDARVLLLKIYYELNYIEGIISLIDSFKHFINKNKLISKETKEFHLYFLKYLTITIKAKETIRKKNIEELKHEILNSKSFCNKNWLLIKVAELEN